MLLFSIVNCIWDEWIIGDCSKTCGGGERINTRDKLLRASHGGKPCSPEDSTLTEKCNINECPGNYFVLFKFMSNFGCY